MLEEDKMSYDETDVDNQNAAEQDCETEEEDGSWYGGLPIVSATEALALVEGANSGGLRRSIADLVLNFDDISVDSVSLHNLTNVFLTSHDFESALDLAKLGLVRFPRSVTHLADAVQACARLGRIEEGMAFVNQALEIRMDRWDWYLVVWVASFFKYALDSLPDDECEALVSKAVDILNSYEACHAFDERVRNQKAEVLAAANHMAEAAEELEDAIFSPQRTPIDKSMTLMPASQCCMTYLQLFGSTVAARKIGDVARRGYASLAQNHQSASASAFLLYEAFALDSEISNQREYADGFGNETKVTQLLDAYEIAYRQADDEETRELIRQRFDVACSRAHLKNRTLE